MEHICPEKFVVFLLVSLRFMLFHIWKSLTKKTDDPLLKVNSNAVGCKKKSKQAISRNWQPNAGSRSCAGNVREIYVQLKNRGFSFTTTEPLRQVVAGYRNSRHFEIFTVCPAIPVYNIEDPSMRYEVFRLASFNDAAEAELRGQYVTRLAADGYFFNEITRAIRCFDCGAEYPAHFPYCTRHAENFGFPSIPQAPEVPQTEDVAALRIVSRPPQRMPTSAIAAESHPGLENTLGAEASAAAGAGAGSGISADACL